MNTNQNSSAHKVFCTALLLLSSGISLYLTVSFMYQLGLGAGIPIVLALIGVAFDLFKSYAPTLIVSVINRSKIITIFFIAFSVSLMFSDFNVSQTRGKQRLRPALTLHLLQTIRRMYGFCLKYATQLGMTIIWIVLP